MAEVIYEENQFLEKISWHTHIHTHSHKTNRYESDVSNNWYRSFIPGKSQQRMYMKLPSTPGGRGNGAACEVCEMFHA